MRPLIIYAPNVASSGGVALLRALILALHEWQNVTLFLDNRSRAGLGDIAKSLTTIWSDSSISGRLRAEARLFQISKPGDIVFCFHNIPPIFPNQARIICYVHNANLVGLVPPVTNVGSVRLRYFFERTIARVRKSAVERYVVQTETMKGALEEWFGPSPPPIDVLPFIDKEISISASGLDTDLFAQTNEETPDWDFIYVSDGSPHKNHRHLFQAWALLASEGLYPSLAVTLDPARDEGLLASLKQTVNVSNAQIENIGRLSRQEALNLYARSKALIFPSIAESFGLPLLEAEARKMPILAPELDYVRDVCFPAETFDARSERSIARAVKRFMGALDSRKSPPSADEFLSNLLIRL